jgi:hypothetical protein
MQFRRKAVTVKSVIWPAVLLTSVALILMTVWTVVEGFRWVRTVIDPVTGASFGKCKGQHTVAYFTPIFLLLCFSAFLTAFMAYKTKVRKAKKQPSEQNRLLSASFLPLFHPFAARTSIPHSRKVPGYLLLSPFTFSFC